MNSAYSEVKTGSWHVFCRLGTAGSTAPVTLHVEILPVPSRAVEIKGYVSYKTVRCKLPCRTEQPGPFRVVKV